MDGKKALVKTLMQVTCHQQSIGCIINTIPNILKIFGVICIGNALLVVERETTPMRRRDYIYRLDTRPNGVIRYTNTLFGR